MYSEYSLSHTGAANESNQAVKDEEQQRFAQVQSQTETRQRGQLQRVNEVFLAAILLWFLQRARRLFSLAIE